MNREVVVSLLLRFRAPMDSIEYSTFIRGSNRVYPESGIKPIAVLNAILDVLNKQGVTILYQQTWTGWTSNNDLVFNTETVIKSDYTILLWAEAAGK
jgi:predicted flavoprotein YhiN